MMGNTWISAMQAMQYVSLCFRMKRKESATIEWDLQQSHYILTGIDSVITNPTKCVSD
jgi:hypothetical protein